MACGRHHIHSTLSSPSPYTYLLPYPFAVKESLQKVLSVQYNTMQYTSELSHKVAKMRLLNKFFQIE